MDTITCSKARARFAKTLDKVCEDHAPVVVTRSDTNSHNLFESFDESLKTA